MTEPQFEEIARFADVCEVGRVLRVGLVLNTVQLRIEGGRVTDGTFLLWSHDAEPFGRALSVAAQRVLEDPRLDAEDARGHDVK